MFAPQAQLISINAARHDAGKHRSLPVVGDAKLALDALAGQLDYSAPEAWVAKAEQERQDWLHYVANNVRPGNRPNSYAQVVGAVNALCDPRDRVLTAAGGLPAEVSANWLTKAAGTVDVEFGYSCMGYEIAGGWGARIAQAETEPERDTVVLVGDGSYLLLNSDIYSSVLTGHKIIVIVCDNGGFAVINKLQNNTGNVSFNNLIADCRRAVEPFSIDFAAHARALGALGESADNIDQLKDAFQRALAADRTTVISIKVDPNGWTEEGHAWWEVGTPQVSEDEKVRQAHRDWEAGRGAAAPANLV